MDLTRNSRKRNVRSPPPASFTFTRSKAHRTRSGQIRSGSSSVSSSRSKNKPPYSVPVQVPFQEEPYSVPVPVSVPFGGNDVSKGISDSEFKNLIHDICSEYCESDSEDSDLVKDPCKKAKRDDADSDLPCATTKDLRARRIYSPLSGACESDREVAELGFQSPSFVENGGMRTESAEIPELGFESPSSAENGDTHVDDVRIKFTEILDEPLNFNQGITKLSDEDLGKESVQTTPPNDVICVDLEASCDVRNVEEADTLVVKDMSPAANVAENSSEGRKNSSVHKSKSVLKPRLPLKLFKAPGSFNYKRLMDAMGDNFGIPKLGHCHEDKKVMGGQGLELPLTSDNHEGSKPETKTDSCTMGDTNGPELASSPMQVDTEKVNGECLSVPSVDDKCVSESKVDPAADFLGARDVGNAFDHGDVKQDSLNRNNLDCAKATDHNGCALEQLGVLNEDCIPMIRDIEICDDIVLNVDQMQGIPQNVKPMDLTRSTQESTVEALYPKADKRNNPLKSKHVHKPYLHGKLIKTPGSVNYRRLLPYFKNLPKDNYGTSGDQAHHKNEEADLYAKEFQLPLPSQSEEASINRQMTVSGSIHDKVDLNILENNISVNPANMSSHGCRPKLPSFQDSSESPMQLDAKEMAHECLSAPSVEANSEKAMISSKNECLSESVTDPCSVVVCDKIVTNGGSPPKEQNLLNVNNNISNLSFENHSSNEKGFTIDYDERKQFVSLEEHESVSRCPPEAQSLNQLDPNMLDAEENETSSHAICKNDDVVVLSHITVSNEESSSQSEKIISEKPALPDTVTHGGGKTKSLLNGLVNGSKTPSKGSNNKKASFAGEMKNGSESKTTPVLNRCPRVKFLKHAGSLNYKRLLPILLENEKSNSCAANNDHRPKLQKLLDHTPLLPISDSNLPVTPGSDSNDCDPMGDSTGNSGAQQETELQACDLNSNNLSPRYQLQDKQSMLNGPYYLENSSVSPISVHRDLPITPLGPIVDPVVTREEVGSPALSDGEKSPETPGCCRSLSKMKVTDQHDALAVSSRKGILRKNPRGCRGLCTCLNCVSFRLHAERAFEFSRNQLLDAEEVAQDLMKEVSHLRNMLLERCTDNVNDTPLLDGSQVKEACRKASETEQLAKDRLSQMNDDLNIHCRTPSLQRPSVKFSDRVEEKVIQPNRLKNG